MVMSKMNVFKFELKSNYKRAIGFLITTLIFSIMTIIYYFALENDMQMIYNLMKEYPEPLQRAFGSELILNGLLGYYASFPMVFILIIQNIFAIYLSIFIFNREMKEKVTDFLYTKPKTRVSIYLSKIMAIMTILMINNIFLYTIIYSLLNFIGDFNNLVFFLFTFSTVLIQTFFVFLGILITSFSKKIKSPITVAMTIVMSLFAFSTFAEEKLRPLIVFSYFEFKHILNNISLELEYLLLIVGLTLLMFIISITKFMKKEFE
jgi:ABC-2 type transport system permease protein